MAKGLATEQLPATRISTIVSASEAPKVPGTMSAGTVIHLCQSEPHRDVAPAGPFRTAVSAPTLPYFCRTAGLRASNFELRY